MTTTDHVIELEPSIIPTRKEYGRFDEAAKERVKAFVRDHGKFLRLMAQAANVSYQTICHYLKNDVEFRDEIEAIIEQRNIELEQEARRRAVEGVTRKKYDKDGNLIEEEQVYSDRLMEKLLEANNPEKFRPQRDGGSAAISGGVLLIPVASIPNDPSEISNRLTQLTDLQQRLQEEGERSEGDRS